MCTHKSMKICVNTFAYFILWLYDHFLISHLGKFFNCYFHIYFIAVHNLFIYWKTLAEYKSITEQLNHLKLSNEALIVNFYRERFKEQEQITSAADSSGEIALRVRKFIYFLKHYL